jgi:integrase/recombinase XerC
MQGILFNQQGIQPFLDFLRYEKRYSAHTITAYRQDLLECIDFTESRFGSTELAAITHQYIRSWLAELKETGLTARSLNRKISTLKSFFKFCIKQGWLETTPMARVITPKSGSRLPSFVREEETARLVESLNHSAEDWKSLNARMLINIFYATGMRLSELITLRERQLDLSGGQVKVLGKGNKERIIPISPELVKMIREYIRLKMEKFGKPDEMLLVTEKGKKLYPKYAWLLVNTYLGMASTLDKKSPHVLRHTFATHLMNNGAGLNAVKELLGHSSLAATQVYTHNTIEKLKDIHKKSHPKA